ncbi:MAG: hypothetical protein Q9187_003013 [Circinaria calcarea]
MFQYSSLDSTQSDIRLISLLPGTKSDELRCELLHISPQDNPLYEALSYTWGEQSLGKCTIVLNNLAFSITPNLGIALYHLRYESVARILWIDALCINQLDDEEKSNQVQKMKDIYQKASKVLVWLGHAEQDSDVAMDLIANIGHINLDSIPENIEDRDTRKAWDALLQLFRRQWWTRSWVLQEIAVASSDPLVGCGHKWLPWDIFELAHNLMVRSVSIRVLQSPPLTFGMLCTIRDHRKDTTRIQGIGNLLHGTIAFEATNPRDKVFALLGLAHEDDRSAIDVDYSNSVQQVYTQVAKHLLRKDIHALCCSVNSQSHNLPSWVSDWSRLSSQWSLWMPGTYSASAGHSADIRYASDPCILKVASVLVDRISNFDKVSRVDIAQPTASDPSTEEVLDNIEWTLRAAIKKQPASGLSSLDPCKSDALWRTLVTNRYIFGKAHTPGPKSPAPVDFGKRYEVFRDRLRVPKSFKPELPYSQRKEEYIKPLVQSLQMGNQRFFITQGHRIGLGPQELQQDDMVVLILGADMPFIVRSRGIHHQLIGPSYVHGIMNGEFLKSRTKAEMKKITTRFTLK